MTSITLPDRPLRMLAVGAHPDDIEIGCAGTLLQALARPDAELHTLVLTGTPERESEARTAAASMRATTAPSFIGLPDARLPEHWGAVKDAMHAFRDAHPKPDLVFVPHPDDAHQDHRLIGSLARSVWRGPLILHYEIPKWDGDLQQPNVYVPIPTDTAQRKVRLLNDAFSSQHSRDWWDDDFFLALLRLRGAEAQTTYAEAFTALKMTLELT